MLGAILGAYIFKGVLRDAGYAIVPLAPTPGMVSAFRRRWFRTTPPPGPEGATADVRVQIMQFRALTEKLPSPD